MFSGGDYEEVARWLQNFATAHAKRVDPRIEAGTDTAGPREGRSYGIRLRMGERWAPEAGPLELDFAEVARERGALLWCDALARRIRVAAESLLPSAAPARRA